MRIGAKDHPHRGIAVFEDGAAAEFAQPRGEIGVADAHAEIRLQRAEAEIEQDGFAILRPQRLVIGADFRQRVAAVHRAIVSTAGTARSVGSSLIW